MLHILIFSLLICKEYVRFSNYKNAQKSLLLSGGKDAKYFPPRITSRLQKCTQISQIPFQIFDAFKVRFYRSLLSTYV